MTPLAACVLNLDATAVMGVIGTAKAWTFSHQQVIADADLHLASASMSLRLAESQMSRGATNERRQALQAARLRHFQATMERVALDDSLQTAVHASLTTQQQQLFAVMRSNDRTDVPMAYRVVDRPDEEWGKLRDVLAERETCLREGRTLVPAASDYLAMVEGDSITNASLAAVDMHLETFELVWRHEFAD